jgi:pimeloyl-ACP methyl ester carboxylesterase
MANKTTFPIERRFHTSPALAYLRAGAQGPPVVLLHGWAAFKELWWGTLLALAPRFRGFALDMPGQGESPFLPTATIADLADAVIDFCAAVCDRSVCLVGHSMGGNIAAEIALRRPELIDRLVLVDAAADANRLPGFVQAYNPTGNDANQVDTAGWASLRFSLLLSRSVSHFGRYVPHDHGDGWFRPWLRRASYEALYDPVTLKFLLRQLFNNPLGERLHQIAVPTLVITGQFDSLVPPAHARWIANSIPGARYRVIRGALHNPMDERPRRFQRVLLDFLQPSLV